MFALRGYAWEDLPVSAVARRWLRHIVQTGLLSAGWRRFLRHEKKFGKYPGGLKILEREADNRE